MSEHEVFGTGDVEAVDERGVTKVCVDVGSNGSQLPQTQTQTCDILEPTHTHTHRETHTNYTVYLIFSIIIQIPNLKFVCV